ncbi:antennal-specific protein OS-C [Scaptodrosophila lebanonensis]|uniref:Antennal-specific protein OS-C n=1 Tax=Drosophila lebanonensis TaxID=7225 RepID=A0A6J2THZ7_DROLE|nr:antennal-specific protein OS-C [Scaptodrosophila lebanonensis]
MAFCIERQLMLCGIIMLLYLTKSSLARPQILAVNLEEGYDNGDTGNGENKSEEDDSSSEETVEDSDEPPSRRRRSAETSTSSRAGIPGLPDPSTIIKIAELFQSVGEKIVPIILEAVLPANDLAGERISRDLMILKNYKQNLQSTISNELQAN